MSTIKDWEDLREDYAKVLNMPNLPPVRKLPDNYIFDENESVKWNRDRVINFNKSYDEEVKRLRDRKFEARKSVVGLIADKISSELKISTSKAEKVWDFVSSDTDDLFALFYNLEELIELMHNIFIEQE